MLPGFLERFREVRVVLAVESRAIDLLREDVDVAIRIGPLPDSELIARRLTTFALWPCASPVYLARHAPILAPADLAGHTLFAHADRRETWAFRAPDGAVRDFAFAPGTVIPEPDVIRTLLIGGAGIGLLPEFHAAGAIADGALVRLLPDHEGGCVDAHALYPSHRSLSAKVRVLIDALVEHLTGY
jgi:DNA-binding transcriptional LysR family regulator